MKKTLIIIAIIATAIANANGQAINKSIDISKHVVGIITKDGRQLTPNEGYNVTATIEHTYFGEGVGSLTQMKVYCNGEEQYEMTKLIDGGTLVKTENGYLIIDEMFAYGGLIQVKGQWVVILNTIER